MDADGWDIVLAGYDADRTARVARADALGASHAGWQYSHLKRLGTGEAVLSINV